MNIHHYWNKSLNYIEFIFSGDEVQYFYKSSFKIYLPSVIQNFDAIHPDRWGFILVLAVFPRINRITLTSFGISQALHDTLRVGNICVEPVMPDLKPFQTYRDGHVGIAYSGGIHSYITAALLGSSARLVSVGRKQDTYEEETEQSKKYLPDGMYYSMSVMETKGYSVKLLQTNVQDLYDPRIQSFQFPLLSGMGIILLGEQLNLHSICYGSCFFDPECIYPNKQNALLFRNGTKLYISDFQINMTIDYWRSLFSIIGLHLDFPTCGMSDLFAVHILQKHNLMNDICVCKHSYPSCNKCIDCYYYNLIIQIIPPSSTLLMEDVWHACLYLFPDMCNIEKYQRYTLMWILLMQNNKQTSILPNLEKYRHTRIFYKPHQDTLHNASDANRDQIQKGWEYLVASIQ